MKMKPVYSISIPEYTVDKKPDFEGVGSKIDTILKKHFTGKHIVVRALGSQEHSERSVGDLIQVIQDTGTDRYDPNRKGDQLFLKIQIISRPQFWV